MNESLGQIYESDQQDQHESYNLIQFDSMIPWQFSSQQLEGKIICE